MKIGFLCSGALGMSLLEYVFLTEEIRFVLTDRKSEAIISFCSENKINMFVGNPRYGNIDDFIKDKEIDVLISINYLFLIEPNLINLAKIISFNIHGSLLPKYRGRTPHVWAIINNEKETGVTAHLIDEGCDTGEIIEQIKIEIKPNDTGADVLGKFSVNYKILLDSVINKIKTNKISFKKQDNLLATFFGKRTPNDGLINWDWQRERIKNWVRAQAEPYPGAFTFYKEQKIIIDQVSFSDFGFNSSLQNGTIISISPFIVKTPNGAIEILKIRSQIDNIKINDVLK
jgi:methionyl-tRNA formyltransferase